LLLLLLNKSSGRTDTVLYQITFNVYQKGIIMKSIFVKTATSIVIALSVNLAQAGWDSGPEYPVDSSQSRAEVRAETLKFLDAGGRQVQVGQYHEAQKFDNSNISREQVCAELAVAQKLGLITDGHRTVFPTPMQLKLISEATPLKMG
jgi:hypothetical protein